MLTSADRCPSLGRQGTLSQGSRPASLRVAPSSGACAQVELEGIVRASEQPSSFVPANDPASGQWFWIDVPALASAAGLPPDTPLIEARTP